ncbi:MAG TPA: AarF/UbiB family protein [Pyrinomonadaceae bacterium]|jgi:ubiquinone biosynthesis protein|nr:AarF/UbiB family protein [Pyrinomonadaceae bacterium]
MIFRQSIRRLAYITFVFAKHALAHALGLLVRRRPRLARGLKVGRLSGPERLRVMLEEVGGTFIKFGQMLALQPDIISLEYCDALFNLLDRVTPFSYEEVERIFVEELGSRPSEVFDYIEPRPIATASIGQVHVAQLGGLKLAVKVQRPNVEVDFAGDIRLMSAAIRLIRRLRVRPLYWMLEPLGEFLAWTHEELDYRCEARYMERLRRNAHDNPHERVPEVLARFTTRRTLVAEFFEGETLLAYLRDVEGGDGRVTGRLRATGFDPDRSARNIIDNFLGDVFRHGMFHADLHPANLMILPGNTVGYIDFGITGTISQYSRRNLVALTLAYTRGDVEGMCDAFFRISVLETEASAARFREGLKVFAETWYEAGRERRLRKNFTLVMLDMLRLSRRTGVWPERDVVKYIRSAIAIDGLITRFAPSFDLGLHLQAVCDRLLRWSARRAMLSYDSLLSWAVSGERVVREGPLRAAGLFERLTAGELEAQVSSSGAGGDANAPARRRAVQLGAAVFVTSLAAALTGGQASLGTNLFTAEMIFIGAAAALLLRAVRRLA